MKLAGKRPIAVAAITTLALTLGSGVAFAAEVPGSQAGTVDTAAWTPPSPDPSGIAYLGGGKFIISDAEVEEISAPYPGAYQGVNLFTMTTAGALVGTGTTVESGTGWSAEPVGVAFGGGKLYVVDDDKKSVFAVDSPGGDGVWGTADDSPATPKGFKTSSFNNSDPEGIAYDSKRNELLLANGQTGARFYRLTRGADGVFNGVAPGGDDIAAEYDLTRYGLEDPEGIAYDASRDTIVVSDDGTERLYELDHNGSLLNTVSLAGIDFHNLGDVTVAPSSSGTGNSYWLVDRGLDNNSHPDENDGRVIEVKANLGAITNFPPVANAGVDQLIDLGETVTLNGAGVDSDAGDTLRYAWSVAGPPGSTVSMGTPNAATTTASNFSTVGDYVFTLTVTDGKGGVGTDTSTVRVFQPGDARNVSIPVALGSDDAQEGGGSTGKFVEVDSADNELGHSGGTNMTKMLTGFRFAGLPVPKGAEIVSAKIQFKVDEGSTGSASFTIAGQASDNPSTFVGGGGGDISARPKTTATVPWAPPTWAAPGPDGGDAGPGQLTPNLATVLQEVVNRPGWQKGNAAVFLVWGDGRRTAEAKDGLTPPVLMLEFKTAIPNAAPVVNAGPDQTVTLPDRASLAGSATDDDKPTPAQLTPAWSKVSGPGTVTFDTPASLSSKVTFTEPGDYVLRLTVNDGALSGVDDVTVTVEPQPAAHDLTASVSDGSVMLRAPVRISGSTSAPLSGQPVHLQAWDGTAWVDVATASVTGQTFGFTTSSGSSGLMRYRVHVPAAAGVAEATTTPMKVAYYRAAITRVRHRPDVVKIRNIGAVTLNLARWTLRNDRNRRGVRLEGMKVRPGMTVRIHTGRGRDDANDMYLGRKHMWGKHGKAVLRDDNGSLVHTYRY